MSEYRELANKILVLDAKLEAMDVLERRVAIVRILADVARQLHAAADKERDALYRRLDLGVRIDE